MTSSIALGIGVQVLFGLLMIAVAIIISGLQAVAQMERRNKLYEAELRAQSIDIPEDPEGD